MNLTTLREAIIQAVPEIMELKFGCELKWFCRLSEPDYFTRAFIVEKTESNTYFVFSQFEVMREINVYENERMLSDEFEIIGRPIRLADVLLAIEKIIRGENKRYQSRFYLIEDGGWNLTDDNLDNQSPETIEYLANLLTT